MLPSLNLRLKLNPELQLRFAASKAIARPSLDQLTANITLGGDIETTYLPNPDPNAPQVPAAEEVTSFTGSGGNPLLKPMEADSVRCRGRVVLRAAGLAVHDALLQGPQELSDRGSQVQNLFGQDWEVDTTINGDKGTVKGFEVGYSQFYDALPGWLSGLGMQANYTYVDSKGGSPTPGPSGDAATVPPGLPLEGLSKTQLQPGRPVSARSRRGAPRLQLARAMAADHA